MDGPNFKICEVKKISKWLSNSSTDQKMRLLIKKIVYICSGKLPTQLLSSHQTCGVNILKTAITQHKRTIFKLFYIFFYFNFIVSFPPPLKIWPILAPILPPKVICPFGFRARMCFTINVKIL